MSKAFEFDRAVRWARLGSRKSLARRADRHLPFVGDEAEPGGALLLDTCVYIDQLQDRTPPAVESLTAMRLVHHASVAIMELMHLVGRLDPSDRRSASAIARIRGAIRAMPAHRTFAPDVDTLARAAILSGILCRTQGYAADARHRAQNDCVLFVQALKSGVTLLTRNVADFDFLLQMVPAGRVLLYRQQPMPARVP